MRPLHAACLSLFSILTAGQSSYADIPGRLFFTPQQRATLDNARAQTQEVKAGPATLSGSVTFKGYVQRSDGHTTVWVNREALHDQALDHGKGPPTLRVPTATRWVPLKAGQSMDATSGSVEEGYGASENKRNTAPEAAPQETNPSGQTTTP